MRQAPAWQRVLPTPSARYRGKMAKTRLSQERAWVRTGWWGLGAPPVCVASGESGFFASQVLVHKDLPDSPPSRQKVASRPRKCPLTMPPQETSGDDPVFCQFVTVSGGHGQDPLAESM